ncbi:MAG: cysteine desulfurase family protein [Caldibacillus sp.]
MIYLDNSATTRPYPEVIESYAKAAQQFFGNPSSVHKPGIQAEQLLRQARKQISSLLGVKPGELIFTSGGTEGNNTAIKGIAYTYRSRGKHIITTSIEHPSVTNVCEQLKKDGFDITYLPVDEHGRVKISDIKQAIRDDTILVSIMHVNNEVGTIQPIEEIGQLLQNYPKIFFHVDQVQGVTKVPLDYYQANVDLATISAHKFHGLKGTGVLFVREGIRFDPLLSGGGQENNFRSGTENTAGIVAMAKALRLAMEASERKIKRMKEIQNYFFTELKKIPEVRVNTPLSFCAPHIINFSVPGFKTEVLITALSERGVYVSTTSACSVQRNEPSKTLLAMGLGEDLASSSVRISLSFENTLEEAQTAMQAIRECIDELNRVMKG